MGAALPAMNGFIYRRIGDADLAAYVKFNSSALGQRYNQAVTGRRLKVLQGQGAIGAVVRSFFKSVLDDLDEHGHPVQFLDHFSHEFVRKHCALLRH